MKYSYGEHINLEVEPLDFNKDSGKEVLQFAVGGLLYMPASNATVAEKIIDGRFRFIKSMVLDLEDSLGDDMVNYGKRSIVIFLETIDNAIKSGRMDKNNLPLLFVRVREASQMVDLQQMVGDKFWMITGFNVPKFDKTTCDDFIDTFSGLVEYSKTEFKTNLYMMPIIESKFAMYRQLRMDNLLYINNALRGISDNVLNVRVGGADFCSVFGIRRKSTECIHDIGVVRSVFSDIINVFGKSYIISAPVWEYFGKDREGVWAEGLRNEIKYDKLNGFIGKTSIHPSQLPIIQESLIVDKVDYLDAMNILGMNSNTTGVAKGAICDGGSRMNEVKTHTNWAKKVVSLANVYGVNDVE